MTIRPPQIRSRRARDLFGLLAALAAIGLLAPALLLSAPPSLRPAAAIACIAGALLPGIYLLARRFGAAAVFSAVILPAEVLTTLLNVFVGAHHSVFVLLYAPIVLTSALLCGTGYAMWTAFSALVLLAVGRWISHGVGASLLLPTYVLVVCLGLIAVLFLLYQDRERIERRRHAAVIGMAAALSQSSTPQALLFALVESANVLAQSSGAGLYASEEGRYRLVAAAGDFTFDPWTPPESPRIACVDIEVPAGGTYRFAFADAQGLESVWSRFEVKLRATLQRAAIQTAFDHELESLRSTIDGHGDRLSHLHLDAIEALVTMLERRDPYTAGHSRRVATYSLLLGQRLGMSPAELGLLRRAASVHDIGKVALPDSILLKPGPLTDEEWGLMKRHPEIGVEILERVPDFVGLLPGVRWHHERWDGRGYPDGLAGLDIPLQARVMAVADAFDAMTSTRSYRDARTVDQALAILREGGGSQWCSVCAGTFVEMVEQGEINRSERPRDSWI